jgi:hypothetical protein
MNPRCVLTAIALCSFMLTNTAIGQEGAADDPLESSILDEPELTWSDYTVKAYTVQIFGGWFGGTQYLNLPLTGPRAQYAELPLIMSYSGDWWQHGTEEGELNYHRPTRSGPGWDSPIKTIEDGITLGLKLCSYIGNQVHIDLLFAYSSAQASLTMVNREDEDNVYRAEIDRDPNVQVLRAAMQISYDIHELSLVGLRPYLGIGFGGVLNRFSNLPDRGGLFLIGTFGLQRQLTDTFAFFVQGNLTAFAMSREELHYTKTVTYKDVSAGISLYFDAVPADIRALHETQQAERRQRR